MDYNRKNAGYKSNNNQKNQNNNSCKAILD